MINWEGDVSMLERFFSEYLVFTHVLTLSSTHVAGYRHIRSSGVPHIKEHVVSEHLGVPATTYQFCSDFLGLCQISPPKNSTRLGFGAPRVFAWWRWLWKKGQRWKLLICCQLECVNLHKKNVPSPVNDHSWLENPRFFLKMYVFLIRKKWFPFSHVGFLEGIIFWRSNPVPLGMQRKIFKKMG